jgi:hypothetical protein
MIGFISTSVRSSHNHTYYSPIADLHNFHSTVAHALGFSVSTSRLLATGLSTETSTSSQYEIILVISCSITMEPRNSTKSSPRLSLAQSQSQNHIVTDGQSVSKSWCRAPSGAHDQIFITV